MKRSILPLLLLLPVITASAQNMILPLWEGDPPNYRETGEVTIFDTADIVRVRNVQKPDIAVFLPSRKNATGEAVVICPGGGYGILAYDWEGSDIARWLSSRGIAAFVLKYRLPGSSSNLIYPVISFTADFAHMGSRTALLGREPDEELVRHFSSELQVTPGTPPAILVHSGDDRGVPVENSIAYYRALLENGIPAEMHIYPYGGHGYSLAIGQGHLSTWPGRVADWISYICR